MQENPFEKDDRLEAIRNAVDSAFRLSTLSIVSSAELTTDYLTCCAQVLTKIIGTDRLTTAHALLWESANLVAAVVEPSAEIQSACGHDACAHKHAPTMAFADAAAREDFTAAMNVVKAVVKESNQKGDDPVGPLCEMFAATVASIAYSVMAAPHPRPDTN